MQRQHIAFLKPYVNVPSMVSLVEFYVKKFVSCCIFFVASDYIKITVITMEGKIIAYVAYSIQYFTLLWSVI